MFVPDETRGVLITIRSLHGDNFFFPQITIHSLLSNIEFVIRHHADFPINAILNTSSCFRSGEKEIKIREWIVTLL